MLTQISTSCLICLPWRSKEADVLHHASHAGLCSPPIAIPAHADIAAAIVVLSKIIALDYAQIGSLHIQGITISEENETSINAPHALCYNTMHQKQDSRLCTASESPGITAAIAEYMEVPLPLHEVLIVVVRNYRNVTLGQWNVHCCFCSNWPVSPLKRRPRINSSVWISANVAV
jgi:hypothetical protein